MAPSRADIATWFEGFARGDHAALFEHVSPTVDWTVMGTHPCAGHYSSLAEFQQKTLARLLGIMKHDMKIRVRNVIGGGQGQDWAAVELVAHGVCQNGFKYDNTHAWIVHFDDDDIIVEVRGYMDTWMVNQALVENESGPVEACRAPVP